MSLRIACVLACIVTNIFAQTVYCDSKKNVSKDIDSKLLKSVVNYSNQFSSFRELLSTSQTIRILAKDDVIEVTSILSKYKVNLNAKPAEAKLIGNSVKVRNLGWSDQWDGSFRTLDGIQVKVDKSDTFSVAFKKMFYALVKNDQEAHRFRNIFFSDAEADSGDLNDDSASAGFEFGMAYILKGLITAGGPLAGEVLALSGMVMESVHYLIDLGQKLHVSCDGGLYVANAGFPLNQFDSFDHGETASSVCDPKSLFNQGDSVCPFCSFSRGGCNMTQMAAGFAVDAFMSTPDKAVVTSKALSKVFNGKAPDCKPDTAKKVEKALRAKALEIIASSYDAPSVVPVQESGIAK